MSTATDGSFINGNHVPIPVGIVPGQQSQNIGNRGFTGPAKNTSTLFHNDLRPLKMIFATPGDNGSLCFVDDESLKVPIKPDEVEIKALAYTMDEDVMDIMLGNGGNTTNIGECTGVITALGSDFEDSFQIGDHVCGWNTNVAFASQTRVKGSFVRKISKSWSAGMGAVLPQNTSIAYYGLSYCAQVESGQTVLVHGASGSLGQAVILVANALGLQVIATVNTEAEKQVLMSRNGTKPAYIFYSDDVTLLPTLLDLTRGAGVDVVFNTLSTAPSEELIKSVAPLGTVVDIHSQNSFSVAAGIAIKYVSFDTAQLLRHRPSIASAAFQAGLALLPEEHSDGLFPITTVSIADAARALEAVKGQAHVGRMVLLADEDTMVQVKETIQPTTALASIEPLIRFVAALGIPPDQKNTLLALIAQSSTAGFDVSSVIPISAAPTPATSATTSSVYHDEASAERRLASASSMFEARQVIFEGLLQQLASLVALSADEVGPREPLMDLGLDSMMVIEFKDWLRSEFGSDVGTDDIVEAAGLDALATLVAQKSTFVPSGLPEGPTTILADGIHNRAANGSIVLNGTTNGLGPSNRVEKREFRFVPNQLPRFPLPDIDALCNAFLIGVKAFATPEELAGTMRAVEEFKRPGSAGRGLYDRAAALAADPNIKNWEFELQLRRGYLDRRGALTPCTSFWFGHPLSKQRHSQAERAAIIAYTANNFKLKLEAGLAKPVVLNDQELTTAYYPWIFNAVRIPAAGSDEMQRYPNNDYCVVLWKGHAFQLSLCVGNRPATQKELFTAFEVILNQSVARSFVPIFTSDNRHPWAEARKQLQQLDSQNAASIAIIEAAAFTISLDEAEPSTAVERSRQFHFGGEKDAANRWHDKTLQFVVCSNGSSGTLGEHTMLEAQTMGELSDAIAAAIRSHPQTDVRHAIHAITPVPLPLKTDATLNAHIDKVRAQYTNVVQDAEHAYFLFEGYGSKALRAQKLAPNSVFQMIVQLAAQSLYGYSPPCFETVNRAHYHLGRLDIIQVITTQVAAFLSAARDPSVDMAERRALLSHATRSHVAQINKARRNLGWERNFTAMRALVQKDEPVPALYEDPVYKRVRPRLMMSNCFETGMLEKACMSKDPDAVWLHYEVYEENVYFTVVTKEGGRATRFLEHVKEAAELVRQIVFTA